MAYDKAVDSAQLDATLTSIADALRRKNPELKDTKINYKMFADQIDHIKTGGSQPAESNIEMVEFTPPKNPTFKHATGQVSIWGWGFYDTGTSWTSSYYCFYGDRYSGAINDTGNETIMNLSVVDGRIYGLPEMSTGKCLAILKQ